MSFEPNQNTKLRAWWDANDPKNDGTQYIDNQVIGDTSYRWKDKKSGYYLGQATPDSRPIFRLDIQNSMPGIQFDGTNDYLLNTSDSDLLDLFSGTNKSLTVVTISSSGAGVAYFTTEDENQIVTEEDNPVVFTHGGANGYIYSFGSNIDDDPLFGTQYDSTGVFNTVKRNDSGSHLEFNGGSYIDNEVDIVSVVNSGTALSVYQNLELIVEDESFSVGSSTITGFAVGALYRNAPILHMQGFIFEVMIFEGELDADELKEVNQYAGDKWAIYVRDKIKEDAQSLSGQRLIKLYELDATSVGGSLMRFISVVDATNEIESITSVSTTATAITKTPHTMEVDDTFNISGVNQSNYNGDFSVDSVIDLYSFTYTMIEAEDEVAQGSNMLLTRLNNMMVFNGNNYSPVAFESEGFEWASQGSLPTPKIRISNVGKIIAAAVISLNDLVGCKFTRIRTFRKHLDDGTDPDPTAIFPREIYTINRKSVHNKVFLEFELASKMDQQGVKIPGRQCIKRVCTHIYRSWNGSSFDYTNATCPYTGSSYFTSIDASTSNPSEDKCAKQLNSCKLRFGNLPLPTRAFPGIGGTSS